MSWNPMPFSNLSVLVTGAGRGIGQATAIKFASAGASLVLCDIDESSLEHLKLDIETQLINKLLTFPEVIRKSSQTLEPQNISNYLAELASSFHSYYAKEKVIDLENKILTEARIYLINATRIVIRNGLKVLGVSAPEQM